jgi:hypothetical protein
MTRRPTRIRGKVLTASLGLALLVGVGYAVIRGAPTAAPPIAPVADYCGKPVLSASSWLSGRGVTVRSNYPYQGKGTPCGRPVYNIGASPPQYGLAWQCVELAARLYNTKGWHKGRFGVDYAAQIYDRAPAIGMSRMPNGSINLAKIRPGDMVVSSERTFGHVAIADAVFKNKVYVVEQNASTSGRAVYTFSGGRLSRSGFTIRGVVHDPQNTTVQWAGKIVQKYNGPGQRNTSWIVDVYGRRHWIPGTTTYYCMINQGYINAGVQPDSVLNYLPIVTPYASC